VADVKHHGARPTRYSARVQTTSMRDGTDARRTARHTESPLQLMASAIGGPAEAAAKLGRLASLLSRYVMPRELDEKLARLHAIGIIETVPTKIQLLVGARDMLRFWIVPASDEYYAHQDISFAFHQLLRFLDEPASLADPVGFFSTRDGIIGHLMQVVHANPHYDLQLLCMYEDGLAELEAQIEQMIAGTHPRAAAIGAIVEEPDYHARLLDYTRRFRADPSAPPPLRSNVSGSPHFLKLEKTFGSLRGAMRYFCRMPASPLAAARHLLFVNEVPEALLESA
jgi:hypothetical protein